MLSMFCSKSENDMCGENSSTLLQYFVPISVSFVARSCHSMFILHFAYPARVVEPHCDGYERFTNGAVEEGHESQNTFASFYRWQKEGGLSIAVQAAMNWCCPEVVICAGCLAILDPCIRRCKRNK
jgi:hypothetical protein